jgi:tRNA modification GTPase
MADADVVLLVVDAAVGGISNEDDAVLARAKEGSSAVLVAWNKVDLIAGGEADSSAFDPAERDRTLRNDKHDLSMQRIATSAVTGEGIAELRAAVVRAVAGEERGLRESGMLTNLRQHQAIERALHGLDAANTAMSAGTPHEMVLLDLYEGLRGLDALTGTTTNEDVLRLIFSTFCIGK